MESTHSSETTREIKVPQQFAGSRADVFISRVFNDLSRSQIIKLIRGNNILINGAAIKPSRILAGGEVVTFDLPVVKDPSEPGPEEIDLKTIYEDDHIIVVDKPAGLVVHPGSGTHSGTLVNALLYHYPEIRETGERARPGIVHRLDKETSGVMVVARSDTSRNNLVEQFRQRKVEKEYIAIICGSPEKDSGVFTSGIGRHTTNRIKMSSRTNSPKQAYTQWNVLGRYGKYSLVKVVPKTGRTHQIRVHFSEAGFPVLEDSMYGGKRSSDGVTGHELGRHALHSHVLRFLHPYTQKKMEFISPIPSEFKSLLEFIDENRE